MYDSFRPGQVWLDTEGKRIQAHGGSVIYVDGIYYWYGENKEFTDGQMISGPMVSVFTGQMTYITGRILA